MNMSFTDTMLLPCKHDVHTRSQRQLDTTNLRPRMRVHVTTPVLHKQMDATTHCELQRRIRGPQQQTAWDVKPTSNKETRRSHLSTCAAERTTGPPCCQHRPRRRTLTGPRQLVSRSPGDDGSGLSLTNINLKNRNHSTHGLVAMTSA